MNGVDILLLAVVAFALWRGWQKGFALGLSDLLVWVGSLLAALVLFPVVSGWVADAWPASSAWAPMVSFLALFFVSRLLLESLLTPLLYRIPGQQHVANKPLGLLPGAIHGVILATLLAAFLLMLPFPNPVSEHARNSKLATRAGREVARAGEILEPLMPRGLPPVNITPDHATETNERVNLPFKVKDLRVRADLETQMLSLVNKERVAKGLKPLIADPELAAVARKHSRDMFGRGYFAHNTPEGKSPFDRIREDKVRFLTAGENLAFGRSLKQCHEGLMNSPGHRANILHPSFGRLGIGILDGGIYGLMITQNFRN